MYEVTIDPYKIGKENEEIKAIVLDDKEIYLSVGGYLSWGDMPYTLLITAHYDSETSENITDNIPDLKSFEPYIAINPKFKDKKLIAKMKELDLISDTIKEVKYKNKNYEIVKANIELLKEYKPFGDSILKDYRDKGDLVL